VGEHDRVVVDVDDARVGRGALRYLVRVVQRRQTRADVQELADPPLLDEMADHPPEELAVRAGHVADDGEHPGDLVADGLVDLVVVLPADPVVPDPGVVRHPGVEPPRTAGRGLVLAHVFPLPRPRHGVRVPDACGRRGGLEPSFPPFCRLLITTSRKSGPPRP
jgi:hypothetical protein